MLKYVFETESYHIQPKKLSLVTENVFLFFKIKHFTTKTFLSIKLVSKVYIRLEKHLGNDTFMKNSQLSQ